MYRARVNGIDAVKKIKGVKASVVKNAIDSNHYLDSLQNLSIYKRQQCMIRSEIHNVMTIRQKKLALNPFDDERYSVKGSTDTLPNGHYKMM